VEDNRRESLNEMHLWALSAEGEKMFTALVNHYGMDPDLAFEITEIELGSDAYAVEEEQDEEE